MSRTIATVWPLLAALFVSGCAHIPEPVYLDVGVGYQIDSHSDWYVRTEREWQCSDPFQGQFALGWDFGATEIEYYHQSWIACGGPFGDGRPELYQDSVNLRHRFGGRE